MKLSNFDFNLPPELLAEYPTENRDEARLMVIHRDSGKIEHRLFKDLVDYFGEGDVMIVSIWNRKGTIFEGYHTFAVQKVNGELMVYNRFNNSAESTEKKTMGEVIENGQFIVGYRVQNAK